MMSYSTYTFNPAPGAPVRPLARLLVALNLAYPVLVVLERLLNKAGIGAFAFVWPRYSPSLGDVLQGGLLLGALVAGLAPGRRSAPVLLLTAVTASLLLMQTFHPHLRVAPGPVPAAAAYLFPALNAAQGQKLLMGAAFWLVMLGMTLLAGTLAAAPLERRLTKLFLAAFCLIGMVGGLGDYLGMAFNNRFPAAGTIFGLVEEGGELAATSLMLLIMLRFARR